MDSKATGTPKPSLAQSILHSALLVFHCFLPFFQTFVPFGITRSCEASSTHTAHQSSSNCWYTRELGSSSSLLQVCTARPPLLLNHLTHWLHCTAPACSLIGFVLSALHLCHVIPASPLKLLPHSAQHLSLISLHRLLVFR